MICHHLDTPVTFTHRFLHCASPVPSTGFYKIDEKITIDTIEPVGHYTVRLKFSDGFDEGIDNWTYLYWLSRAQAKLMTQWQRQENRDQTIVIYSRHWVVCKK